MPVSAVLGSEEVMLTIRPGEHGSTFGGNPLGCAVAMAALRVLDEEGLAHNALRMGERMRSALGNIGHEAISEVRGRGLLNAIVIEPRGGKSAADVCLALKELGLLTKPTREHILRLAPPLVINEGQVDEAVDLIGKAVRQVFG